MEAVNKQEVYYTHSSRILLRTVQRMSHNGTSRAQCAWPHGGRLRVPMPNRLASKAKQIHTQGLTRGAQAQCIHQRGRAPALLHPKKQYIAGLCDSPHAPLQLCYVMCAEQNLGVTGKIEGSATGHVQPLVQVRTKHAGTPARPATSSRACGRQARSQPPLSLLGILSGTAMLGGSSESKLTAATPAPTCSSHRRPQACHRHAGRAHGPPGQPPGAQHASYRAGSDSDSQSHRPALGRCPIGIPNRAGPPPPARQHATPMRPYRSGTLSGRGALLVLRLVQRR